MIKSHIYRVTQVISASTIFLHTIFHLNSSCTKQQSLGDLNRESSNQSPKIPFMDSNQTARQRHRQMASTSVACSARDTGCWFERPTPLRVLVDITYSTPTNNRRQPDGLLSQTQQVLFWENRLHPRRNRHLPDSLLCQEHWLAPRVLTTRSQRCGD